MPQPRGESWKAPAREVEQTVQARTVGITDLGAERVVADKAQTYWPRLEGLAPWFLRNANGQDTYELLNKSPGSWLSLARASSAGMIVGKLPGLQGPFSPQAFIPVRAGA